MEKGDEVKIKRGRVRKKNVMHSDCNSIDNN
jgi:hypothetical protein